MTTGPDPTSLFEGLDGRALEEREELISWLLDQGFDLGQIAGAVSPMFLPANRVLGHDGTLVSADDVAQASGVPVALEGGPRLVVQSLCDLGLVGRGPLQGELG